MGNKVNRIASEGEIAKTVDNEPPVPPVKTELMPIINENIEIDSAEDNKLKKKTPSRWHIFGQNKNEKNINYAPKILQKLKEETTQHQMMPERKNLKENVSNKKHNLDEQNQVLHRGFKVKLCKTYSKVIGKIMLFIIFSTILAIISQVMLKITIDSPCSQPNLPSTNNACDSIKAQKEKAFSFWNFVLYAQVVFMIIHIILWIYSYCSSSQRIKNARSKQESQQQMTKEEIYIKKYSGLVVLVSITCSGFLGFVDLNIQNTETFWIVLYVILALCIIGVICIILCRCLDDTQVEYEENDEE